MKLFKNITKKKNYLVDESLILDYYGSVFKLY